MPLLHVEQTLSAPSRVAEAALSTVLAGYAERDKVTLSVETPIAHGSLSIPVRLTLQPGRHLGGHAVSLAAREHAGWFPVFTGEIWCTSGGPLATQLSLAGAFDAPFGSFGAFASRVALDRAAEQSLKTFADALRVDVLAEIRRTELAIRH